MALLDIATAWESDPTTDVFRKFLGACLVAASAVLNEDGDTPNHANRVVWANGMLSADRTAVQARVARVIGLAAATNATFQADPGGLNDGAYQFIVNSLLDAVATGS